MNKGVSKTRTKRSKQRDRFLAQTRRKRESIPLLSILAFVALWALTVALLVAGHEFRYSGLAEGQRSPATMTASVDFETEDIPGTQLLRQRVSERTPPVFSVSTAPLNRYLRIIDDAIRHLESSVSTATNEPVSTTKAPEDIRPWLVPFESLSAPETIEALRNLSNTVASVWNRGILEDAASQGPIRDVTQLGMIRVISEETGQSRNYSLDNVLRPAQAVQAVEKDLDRLSFPFPKSPHVRSLLESVLQPNLVYEDQQTRDMRQQAMQDIAPLRLEVRAGTTLVEKGERISPHILELVRRHQIKQESLVSSVDRAKRQIGMAGLLLLITALGGSMLYLLRWEHLMTPNVCWLLAVAVLLVLVPTKAMVYFSATTRFIEPALVAFLAPMGLTAMLAAILCGPLTALCAGLLVTLGAVSLANFSFSLLMTGVLSSGLSILLLRRVRRRSDVFRAGLATGVATALAAICIALVEQYSAAFMVPLCGAALAGGLIASILTLLFLPLFEVVFHRTTDIRLLELSDMGHPLLQRLALEAPGTYHHSLMVASLAQSAAQDIGCNALLARVCAYFHDIGKLTKPECFIENVNMQANPHDVMSPSMSTLVIISHVKEGVSLALRFKLPKPIREGIQQHHGTSRIAYFYHRAKKSSEQLGPVKTPKEKPKEESFRYPGPKPKRPEMGILLLADSVEAASRSMEKISPSKIEALVQDIVEEKVRDGQLDECRLTFSEVGEIKRSLIFNLTNMVHGRTKYPDDENSRADDPSKEPTSAPPPPPALSLVHEEGTGTES